MKAKSSKKKNLKKKSRSRLLVIGLALCLCLVLGSGGIYIYQRHVQKTQLIEQMRAAARVEAREEREKRKAEIQALFDAYLNEFKSELIEKAQTYKKTRRLLKNLIRPINYTDTASAKENYFLFKESLAPTLRKQSVEIIGVFENYSNKIKNDLSGDENELQKTFLAQWEDMSRKQLTSYIDFFASEEEFIQAYDALITFYYSHSKRYALNDLGNGLDFSNPDDEMKAKSLLKRVKDLQKSVKENAP